MDCPTPFKPLSTSFHKPSFTCMGAWACPTPFKPLSISYLNPRLLACGPGLYLTPSNPSCPPLLSDPLTQVRISDFGLSAMKDKESLGANSLYMTHHTKVRYEGWKCNIQWEGDVPRPRPRSLPMGLSLTYLTQPHPTQPSLTRPHPPNTTSPNPLPTPWASPSPTPSPGHGQVLRARDVERRGGWRRARLPPVRQSDPSYPFRPLFSLLSPPPPPLLHKAPE